MLTIHILLKLQDVDLNLKDIYFLLTLNLGFLGIVQKLLTIEIFHPRWWNTLLTTEKAASTQDNGRIIFLFFITHLLFFTSNLIYCSILTAFIRQRKRLLNMVSFIFILWCGLCMAFDHLRKTKLYEVFFSSNSCHLTNLVTVPSRSSKVDYHL